MRTKHFPKFNGQANGLKDGYILAFVNMLFTRGEELMVANRIQMILNRGGDLRLSGWIPCHHKGLLDVGGGGGSPASVNKESQQKQRPESSSFGDGRDHEPKNTDMSKIWER